MEKVSSGEKRVTEYRRIGGQNEYLVKKLLRRDWGKNPHPGRTIKKSPVFQVTNTGSPGLVLTGDKGRERRSVCVSGRRR